LEAAGCADACDAPCPDTACVKKLLSHGTTTAVYYASIHLESTKKLADICLAIGQRALVGKVSCGRAEEKGALGLA
jgi:cytosine/adenosine deaminase-related metal-dependent hydrolase